MASTTALSIYNHFLTSYAPKSTQTNGVHKKSELRNVYNSIVKLNKESPLFLLKTDENSKAYAIGLKENARELQNTITSLGGIDETSLLNKKNAYTTDASIVTANYIGTSEDALTAPKLDISVHSLATPQRNMGVYLPSNEKVALKPDTYSFDLNIDHYNYEFQFQIQPDDSNLDIQNRLTRLINNADIGLHAEVLQGENNQSSLVLNSNKTGLPFGSETIFNISDDNTSKTNGTLSYLGVSDVTSKPQNASFTINGTTLSSASNNFTVEKTYELTLNGISSDEQPDVEIGIKADTDTLTENLHQLIGGYNHFMKTASEFTSSHPRSSQLVREMNHISTDYSEAFEKLGLTIQEDGTFNVEDDMLSSNLDEDIQGTLNTVKNFAGNIYRKASKISIDPMNYVDKTIVAYKNPGKNYANPYITSAYSGMMFNGYC